ncbi:MAG TPA: succinate dehydrogenase iron-sulfur subunit [Chloroflexota bacterium]|nr:succinate dehydrogenase iron-sulfur subunit [Chloroflexota bacterium]
MQVRLKIRRFDPDRDQRPYWQEYDVDVEPMDRVLDALNAVKWYQDGSLTYRRSCAHGVCGSDAMVINGRNRLACKMLVRDAGKRIQIEPLRGFPVIKDLVVDMEPFFAKYRAIKPYLINNDPPPEHGERLQSPEERAVYDDTTKCILCGACTGACPPFWTNNAFVGPAAIVNAHRFIFDSRDQGADERLAVLNQREGVWRCRTVFNCVEACPRGIDITKAIGDIKRLILMR